MGNTTGRPKNNKRKGRSNGSRRTPTGPWGVGRGRKPQPTVVYTLNCKQGRKYVGMTNNLNRRYWQHSHGKGAKWTKKYAPTSIASVQYYNSRTAARKAEQKQYMAMKRKHGAYVRGGNNCRTHEKICYNCGEPGHYANRCKKKRKR